MRNEVKDAERGILGIFVYFFLLMIMFYGYEPTLSFVDAGTPFIVLMSVTFYRFAPLGIYFFFCIKKAYFGMRGAKKDHQTYIFVLFSLFLVTSWVPILWAAEASIKVTFLEDQLAAESNIVVQALLQAIASTILIIANNVKPIFFIMFGFAFFAIINEEMARTTNPEYQANEIYEKHKWETIKNKKIDPIDIR